MRDEPRRRVLVVEDDRWTRDFFSEALRAAGFEVRATETMAAAIEALRQSPVQVVVADLQLPDIRPVDVLAALRATAPTSRLIVCSGSPTDELRADAVRFGAAAVLEKPVSLQRLVETVTAAAMIDSFADPQPPVVIIVRVDRLELRDILPTLFRGAHLVVDRRRRERREARRSVPVNRRRRGDRRQPLTAAEERSWREEGFRIVYRAGK